VSVVTVSGMLNVVFEKRKAPLGLLATEEEEAEEAEEAEETEEEEEDVLEDCAALDWLPEDPRMSSRRRLSITASWPRVTKSLGPNFPFEYPRMTPMEYISPTASSKNAPSETSPKTEEPRMVAAIPTPTPPTINPMRKAGRTIERERRRVCIERRGKSTDYGRRLSSDAIDTFRERMRDSP
jgi:hypothetical protein